MMPLALFYVFLTNQNPRLRSGIKESTRLKRDGAGVVDAISAEDIGKFPDTNLAESLQRITGVSIDRTSAYDGTIPQAADDIVITNEPAIGQLYSMPSDLRYSVADRERTRTNAQINLQFRPSDKLTATLDYTYSQQDLHESRAEQSALI